MCRKSKVTFGRIVATAFDRQVISVERRRNIDTAKKQRWGKISDIKQIFLLDKCLKSLD